MTKIRFLHFTLSLLSKVTGHYHRFRCHRRPVGSACRTPRRYPGCDTPFNPHPTTNNNLSLNEIVTNVTDNNNPLSHECTPSFSLNESPIPLYETILLCDTSLCINLTPNSRKPTPPLNVSHHWMIPRQYVHCTRLFQLSWGAPTQTLKKNTILTNSHRTSQSNSKYLERQESLIICIDFWIVWLANR